MKGTGRMFAVDACVGAAALDADRVARGAPADPGAKACHDALKALLDFRHIAVFDRLLTDEWAEHVGNQGLRWRAKMKERGLLRTVETFDTSALADQIRQHLPAAEHAPALKDTHLIALGLIDRRLLSINSKDRKRFARLVPHAPELAGLHWADPVQVGALDWLRARAPDEPTLTLGAASDD
jgi:diadenosine tetraphosphatase ApaH/serine/threonine PP2A family protein phosphatase